MIRIQGEKVVYFHLGGLGDSVHDLSVLSQLLVEFPNGQIYYICNKGGEDILRYSYLWEKVKVITINSKINVISAIFLPLKLAINFGEF